VREPEWFAEWPGGEEFVNLLSQRGYVVFFPDYRLSAHFGFDKLLQTRDRDELFQPDFEDIMSGVEMLERQGIADPKRLGLLGHSWGSFEANWIVTHTTLFAAAVSYEGDDIFFGWGKMSGPGTGLEWYLKGSPLERPDVWRRNSALYYAGAASTPTLFVNCEYGDNAAALPWLYAAWRSRGLDTAYVYYPGESHAMRKHGSQVDLINRITKWLEVHGVQPTK
jgi:dipeptidyl aminopeptidase/acylaminoacyl peptidase